jgi:uncharacterized protein (TIGR00730 family)
MPDLPASIGSVCVYCASSDAADPAYMEAAAAFGKTLAREGLRLVYGGGNIGLMGACARAANEAGGKVLGVMPEFLRLREILYGDVETIVVGSMHERKMVMFEQSDAFVVLPGGIGTLEEAVEMMSWRRLEVHRKPIVFHSPGGFWEPLYALFQHTVDHNLTPPAFMDTWRSVEAVEDILPAVRALAAASGPLLEPRMPNIASDQR